MLDRGGQRLERSRFWLDPSSDTVTMIGSDAGVGFVSTHDRGGRFTSTVLCSQTRGAWPVSQRLYQLLTQSS